MVIQSNMNKIKIKRSKKYDCLIPSVKHYIVTMNADEKKAYDIAKEILGSSFRVEESIGFELYMKRYI